MATEQAPVNGGFASHQQSYGSADQRFTTNNTSTASASSTTQSSSGSTATDIPKDEVGWYFVEQYYTTLSKSPDRLYLFYNKRSQFVTGNEEEKVAVCIGQKAINDKIKELDFQDCKVRITNVDSQGSDQHIVIQVIGEISNNHAPHRKFAQTFVLATQTNGYFVLNDIFRYIADEEVEIEAEDSVEEQVVASGGIQEPAPTATEDSSEELSNSADPETHEADAAKVDKELETAIESEEVEPEEAAASPAAVNGTPQSEADETEAAEETEAAPVATEEKPIEEDAAPAVEEQATQPEKPKEPASTPAATSAKVAPAPAAAPSKPAAPKSWASLVAANRVALPQAPTSTPAATAKATGSAQTQPTATATAAPTAPAAATAASSSQREASPTTSGGDSASGWQTAGADHTKRQGRQPPVGAPTEEQGIRAYIKNVYEAVDAEALRKELTKYGELSYFDVSRQKNCAFVDFTSRAGFQAAVAANPHKVGEDQIFVEERRVRTGNNFQFQRGGGGVQRGRGDGRPAGQGRGGFKPEGGRGGFTPRGRGGAQTPRGRGTSQAA